MEIINPHKNLASVIITVVFTFGLTIRQLQKEVDEEGNCSSFILFGTD